MLLEKYYLNSFSFTNATINYIATEMSLKLTFFAQVRKDQVKPLKKSHNVTVIFESNTKLWQRLDFSQSLVGSGQVGLAKGWKVQVNR